MTKYGSRGKVVEGNTPAEQLAEADQHHHDELEKRLQLVRDRTVGVVLGYNTGFFLSGPGGVSKSHTVLGELVRLKANFRVSNSRLTGRGLFDALQEYPDSVHLLEDVEQMMNDKNAVGVLRSALWGVRRDGERGRQERWITWAYGACGEILFTGGIIIISNRAFHNLPELRAMNSRVTCMALQPTDNQLRALMWHVAAQGYEHEGLVMPPEECRDVCAFVIQESLSLHRPLDMRLLINAFSDYLQWQQGDAGVHWRDMVAARVRERPTGFREEVVVGRRAACKERELEIAREVAVATNDRRERLAMWQERTGKCESALYRRLAELKLQ